MPSWADVGYLSAIPLAAAAAVEPPRPTHGRAPPRPRRTLDGLAIGLAVLLVSWTFVLGPLWRHTDLPPPAASSLPLYPFGDVVIMFLIILSIRSMEGAGRRTLLWVLVGLSAMAVSTDLCLSRRSRQVLDRQLRRHRLGGGLPRHCSRRIGRRWPGCAHSVDASAEVPLLSLVAPYIPVLMALSVVTVELELHRQMDRFSWLTSFGLALLVIARQALAVLDRHKEQASWPSEDSTRRTAGPRGPWTDARRSSTHRARRLRPSRLAGRHELQRLLGRNRSRPSVIVRPRPSTSRGRRPHSVRRGATGRLRRLPSVIILGLVVITSALALIDLYLLASSVFTDRSPLERDRPVTGLRPWPSGRGSAPERERPRRSRCTTRSRATSRGRPGLPRRAPAPR